MRDSESTTITPAALLLQDLNIEHFDEFKKQIALYLGYHPSAMSYLGTIQPKYISETNQMDFTLADKYRLISLAHYAIEQGFIPTTEEEVFRKLAECNTVNTLLFSFYVEIPKIFAKEQSTVPANEITTTMLKAFADITSQAAQSMHTGWVAFSATVTALWQKHTAASDLVQPHFFSTPRPVKMTESLESNVTTLKK